MREPAIFTEAAKWHYCPTPPKAPSDGAVWSRLSPCPSLTTRQGGPASASGGNGPVARRAGWPHPNAIGTREAVVRRRIRPATRRDPRHGEAVLRSQGGGLTHSVPSQKLRPGCVQGSSRGWEV